jgi:hypothetical protein
MEKSKKLVLLSVLLFLFYLIPNCHSQSFSVSYEILDHAGGSLHYRLNIGVQQSLYDYYQEKSHTLYSINDFAKFVTPYALKPIADKLWEIYTDDEDFVNAVLMITHQIPYELTAPPQYPVETIVENKGDCDIFSYIAASITKAGGLDAVLLYYEGEIAHMNIGVSLSHAPHDARGQAYYVTYNSVQYYVAETTGDDWQNGWRVGECPDSLKNANVQIITLENSEQTTFGQVSASYETLLSSAISLTISPTYLIQGGAVAFSGQLSPNLQNETITFYIKVNNSPWVVLGEVNTKSDGYFAYVWNADVAGICYIRASWSGNENYAGADSSTQMLTTLSMFFVVLLGMTVVLVCVGIATFFMSRRSRPTIQEPQPPEVPNV